MARRIGWDAGSGQFIPVMKAQQLGSKAVVETIKPPKK